MIIIKTQLQYWSPSHTHMLYTVMEKRIENETNLRAAYDCKQDKPDLCWLKKDITSTHYIYILFPLLGK